MTETRKGATAAFSSVIRTGRRPAILIMGLCLGAVLPAQERFGEIIGLVSDPSGAAVPNVQVTITNKVTSRVLATQTSATGD